MTMTLKQAARLGGKARALKLSKERRIEIARNAGRKGGLQKGINYKLKKEGTV